MCILITKPAGVSVPSAKILKACCKANPHGFGFVTPTRIFKTMSAKRFVAECATIPKGEPAIIHCRYATHGSVRKENCHPFVSGDWAFAHNGMLNIPVTDDKTDSQTFFESIYPEIEGKSHIPTNVRAVIDEEIGWSKFAFLNRRTRQLFNFGDFDTINGCDFSNRHWEAFLYPKKSIFYGFSLAKF